MSSIPPEATPSPDTSGFLDRTLRPSAWDDYVGQENIKANLKILIGAARERHHPPEHVLFYGPPGLGKTTLAYLMAKEAGGTLKVTSGPAVERVGDLASLLTNLAEGDILFIDEIHRLPKTVEEVLYPAMESGFLHIVIGKGPSARTIELPLPPFTLVAATTRVALISSPLRSRFSGGVFRLSFYTEGELRSILARSASLLAIEAEGEAISLIASRSRYTPRTANYLLKRARDYAQIKRAPLTKEMAEEALRVLEVDTLGLTPADRKILEVLIKNFGGGPVGLGTLAAAIAEEQATVADVHEPYLLQAGLLERTPRGRIATKAAYIHIGEKPPVASESLL
ncbi:MAG TPA: Holliday junction branch migration DNA helicase RuvB [Candidatus Paceibacterota bacterium]